MYRSIEEYERLLDHYALMELPSGASPGAIKRRYRQLAKRWHPDKFEGRPDEQRVAADRMQALNEAYHAIQNAPLQRYDRQPRPPEPRAEVRRSSPEPPRPRSTPAEPIRDITFQDAFTWKVVIILTATLAFLLVLSRVETSVSVWAAIIGVSLFQYVFRPPYIRVTPAGIEIRELGRRFHPWDSIQEFECDENRRAYVIFAWRPRQKGISDHFRMRRVRIPTFQSANAQTLVAFLNRMKVASRGR